LLTLVGFGAGSGVAVAPSMSPASVVSVAATLGDRELTVVTTVIFAIAAFAMLARRRPRVAVALGGVAVPPALRSTTWPSTTTP
jgi:hypothetical protein